MTDHNVVRIIGNNSGVRNQESLVKLISKAEKKAERRGRGRVKTKANDIYGISDATRNQKAKLESIGKDMCMKDHAARVGKLSIYDNQRVH